MKANSYKRVLAYLVDVMIISFVSLLLTSFVPTSENYNKLNKEFETLTTDYRNQEVTMEEYLEKGTDINYQLNKEAVPQTIVSTVLSIIYFVVLAFKDDYILISTIPLPFLKFITFLLYYFCILMSRLF